MPGKLITLTTDFGNSDHFVGAMKGVIAGIAPTARVIDITHEVEPYNIYEGAFLVNETWPHFPKGTIHVVVVDPGVGSARRPLLVEAAGQYFIGPDNGVFSMVYHARPHKVRILSNPKMMRREISRTFHGRDVFAPAAAHLAKGAKPAQFGAVVKDFLRLPLAVPERMAPHCWRGTVLKADRFGNLITNFSEQDFGGMKTRPFELRAAEQTIRRLALHYSEAEPGEVFAIIGSSGYLEIAANQSSAAKMLGLSAGSQVELEIFMTAAR